MGNRVCVAVSPRRVVHAPTERREREGDGLIPVTAREAGYLNGIAVYRLRPIARFPSCRGLTPVQTRTARKPACKSAECLALPVTRGSSNGTGKRVQAASLGPACALTHAVDQATEQGSVCRSVTRESESLGAGVDQATEQGVR